MADPTPVAFFSSAVAPFWKHDPASTARAERWFEWWRIFQFFEIELVRGVPPVHFEWKVVPAEITALPGSRMSFGVMKGADRLTRVIAEAAVLCVREQDIFVLVVTDWLFAASYSSESLARSAEPTHEFVRLGCDEPQFRAPVLSGLGHRRLTPAVHPRGRARDILAGWNTWDARPNRATINLTEGGIVAPKRI